MRYLLVIAHPDDEADIGGTIYRLSKEGHEFAVVILVGKAAARRNLSATLSEDEQKSMEILGVKKVYHADFPNIKMNTVPHLDIVKFIEECIKDWKAEVIITHHPADVNIDHQETAKAVIAASRLFQRIEGIPKLRELLFMEVSSSTEWSLNSAENRFTPNTWIEIGKEGLEKKIAAFKAYKGVMRAYPHPVSVETITGLATYRGSQSGNNYAEAFESVYRSI